MAYPYNKTAYYPTLTQPWYLDVRDWNAKGDGTTDDTAAIQAALNAADSYGGGILFFAPLTYLISGPLYLPNKVYMKGVSGTTNNYTTDRTNFLARVNTIIKLKSNSASGISMIRPKTPNDFNSAGIENIILDGNGGSQSSGAGQFGIMITDTTTPQRSQAQFRNVVIYQIQGTGFYGGYGQHELFLDTVAVYGCTNDGIVLKGEDIKGTRVMSGNNGGVGIKLPGSGSSGMSSGSGRFFDVDSWSNLRGIEISDTLNYAFFNLGIDHNSQGGIRIFSTSSPGFNPGKINIYHGGFSFNSQSQNNGYSDIKLEGSIPGGYGPYDIALIGCQFEGASSGNKQKYAIEDSSTYPRRCVVVDGLFIRSNYYSGVSNKPQAIRDCHDYDTAEVLTEAELHYSWITSNYTFVLGDAFAAVDASGAQRTIYLPALASEHAGRVFYVTKADTTTNRVYISPQSGETINGGTSVYMDGQYQAYMIIHAGTAWIGVKIA